MVLDELAKVTAQVADEQLLELLDTTSAAAIAQTMKVSRQAIYQRAHRARRRSQL